MSKVVCKIISIFLICIILVQGICFADVENEELEENVEVSSYEEKNIPKVASKYTICIERNTETILFENNGFEKTAMASTTKIMTAIIAIEKGNLNNIVKISKNAAQTRGSRLELSENMEISLKDLLYGLMLRSGNDTAVAIAEHIAGNVENFANLMNQKATEIGMNNSHFVTPNGLDEDEHYSTAYDMAILTNYALKNQIFREIVGTKNTNISWKGATKNISNTNELLGNYEGVYGVKTGFTFNAGRCLITACKKNELDVIVVVLGANTKKDRTTDSVKILNYVNSNYKMKDLSSIINSSFKNEVESFYNMIRCDKLVNVPSIYLVTDSNTTFPILKNEEAYISTKCFTFNKFAESIEKDTKVGEMQIYVGNNLLTRYSICLKEKVERKNFFKFMLEILKQYNKL